MQSRPAVRQRSTLLVCSALCVVCADFYEKQCNDRRYPRGQHEYACALHESKDTLLLKQTSDTFKLAATQGLLVSICEGAYQRLLLRSETASPAQWRGGSRVQILEKESQRR
jgi:hypothetical protein